MRRGRRPETLSDHLGDQFLDRQRTAVGQDLVGKLTGAAAVAKVVEEARARGLLLLSAGAKRNIIRILVPLVINDADLDTALERLAQACDAALA